MGIGELRGAALMVAALMPPAVAVFRHAGGGLRLTERFLLGLALAPCALALPALALALLVRLPVNLCLWQSEFLWIVAALWPRAPRAASGAPGEPLPERGHGFPSIAALGSALGAALLVGAVAFTVPMVRMWSDAWFHAAAAVEVARHGVPPQDPNFAGVPFHYFWIYHFVLALLGTAGGLSPFHGMAVLNVWSAIVLVLAVAQLTYRAFGRPAAMWAGAIAVLGLDPLGWAFWIVRGMVGETTGLSVMISGLTGTNGATTALTYRFPPSHVSLLNRFWTGTALTPAIALGVATAWSAIRALDRPSWLAWLRTLMVSLALFAIHPAYAAFVVAGLAVALVMVAPGAGRRAAVLAPLAAFALAFAAAILYVRAWSVPGTTIAVRLGLYERNLWSLLLAIGPWWMVAAPALVVAWRRGPAARFAAAAAAVAVSIAALVVLPELNSDKFFYLGWVSLVPLVAAGVVWWGDRLRLPAVARLTLVTALVLPTAGLYTIGTASEGRSPGVLIRGDAPGTRAMPLATGQEEEAYRFMRERLPADAVVIEKPRPTVNEPVPVLGERRVFCGSLDVYLSNHFEEGRSRSPDMLSLMDEFSVRRGIQIMLFGDGELTETQIQYLSGFSAPLYLVVRRNEVGDDVWNGFRGRPEWVVEMANDEVRLYRFIPGG